MKPTIKNRRGRWEPGQSGNPSGRPSGIGEVTKLRASIAEHLPEIIAQLVTKAKEGDLQASRLLLERVLPPIKPSEQPAVLNLPTDKDLTEQAMAIVRAASDGEIAPGQCVQLLTGLGTLAKIMEIDELERRISDLEEANDANT